MFEQLNSMNSKATRYHQAHVVEHLASQFVLGMLSRRVHQRVVKLSKSNILLEQRINFWQQKFISIDQCTTELPPSEKTWSKIEDNLDFDNVTQKQEKSNVSIKFYRWLTGFLNPAKNTLTIAFSFVAVMFAILVIVNPMAEKSDPLSYVAVLTEQSGQAHLVASTYGESQKLTVNIVNTPNIAIDKSLELWVISKTDGEARSFGVITNGETLMEYQLTNAQWRLIKDSQSLIVTIEESGGSAIGEPSTQVVSRGLCVRLQEWNKNA